MKITKQKIAVGVAGLVTLGSLSGVAMAATDTTGTNFADRLATRFNLNKDDVKSFLSEDRAARHEQMQAKMEERLTQAVTDGKITSAQKDLITSKMQEIKTFMDGLKDKTKEERKTAMDAKIAELKAWATENNIPAPFDHLGPMGGHGKGRGMHIDKEMDGEPMTLEDNDSTLPQTN